MQELNRIESDLEGSLTQGKVGPRSLAVYMHVPYCLQKCLYCDFYSLPLKGQRPEIYVETVLLEMEKYLKYLKQKDGSFPRLISLYVGGGTPTCLSKKDLLGLVTGCLSGFEVLNNFEIPNNIEVTVEANPGTVESDQLAELRAAGVNRLSLGIQTVDPSLLKKIGRIHTRDQARQAIELARRAGFENINLDLIYGLPNQSLEIWKETVEEVLAYNPEHLAAYSLKVEAGTPFYQLQELGKLPLPGEDVEAEMYEWLVERVLRSGYQHYEISNFSKPGYQSIHNQVYWKNQEYLGLGPSAHSSLRGILPSQVWEGGENLGSEQLVRFGNWSDLERYVNLVKGHLPPVDSTEVIESDLEKAETMFLGLRLLQGVSRQGFEQRFGVTMEQAYPGIIERLVQRGLLREDGDRVVLSERAILVANQVFIEFLP
jgi:oxygen-independent coproporphyrinogen-3 oxidase